MVMGRCFMVATTFAQLTGVLERRFAIIEGSRATNQSFSLVPLDQFDVIAVIVANHDSLIAQQSRQWPAAR
jgi:hypothetical protein